MPRPGRSCEGLDPSENWSLVADPVLRRRIQNRINARVHRQRVAIRCRDAMLRQEQESQQQQPQEAERLGIPNAEELRRQELMRDRWRREFIQDKRQRYLEQVQKQSHTDLIPPNHRHNSIHSTGYSHLQPQLHDHYYAEQYNNLHKRTRSYGDISRAATSSSAMSADDFSSASPPPPSAPSPSPGPTDFWPSPRSSISSAASTTAAAAAAIAAISMAPIDIGPSSAPSTSWSTFGCRSTEGAVPTRFAIPEYEYSPAQDYAGSFSTPSMAAPVAYRPSVSASVASAPGMMSSTPLSTTQGISASSVSGMASTTAMSTSSMPGMAPNASGVPVSSAMSSSADSLTNDDAMLLMSWLSHNNTARAADMHMPAHWIPDMARAPSPQTVYSSTASSQTAYSTTASPPTTTTTQGQAPVWDSWGLGEGAWQ